MQLLRTINVLTLASLLILTGCFGLGDDTITPADGEDSHTHSDNHPPNIHALFNNLMGIEDYRAPLNATHEHSIGANVSMYHSVIDIDGDALTMGWDIDLDGTIDFNVSTLSGFETLFIPSSLWHTIPGTYEESMITIAFVAIDSNNAGASQLIDINPRQDVGVFDTSMNYIFAGEDATGSVTDGTGDDLVRITMTQGEDLNWASVSVKISVDDGAPVTCSNGDASGNCDIVEYGWGSVGDGVWAYSEMITIVESGQDLCTSGTCIIKVTITDTLQGITLGVTTAVAE